MSASVLLGGLVWLFWLTLCGIILCICVLPVAALIFPVMLLMWPCKRPLESEETLVTAAELEPEPAAKQDILDEVFGP